VKYSFVRIVIDILITLVLISLALWIGLIAWGAYSQHNISLLINASVLQAMKDNIQSQLAGTNPILAVQTTQEITRLQEAQDKLFDVNTVSFIYQFVTLIILTIGTSVLALMYNQYRREQEHANQAERARTELLENLLPFAAGQNVSIIIASKYFLLYTLCRLFKVTNDIERESSLLVISDYQNDIHKHLESALREKEGFELLWHEVILDIAAQVQRMLVDIKEKATINEKTLVDRILKTCKECNEILWLNGEEFRARYNEYRKKMTGKETVSRYWE
jgi:hypothetical protein